jgi:acyl-CoA synthetase (AMP-forming)/AMP-acid ligase II
MTVFTVGPRPSVHLSRRDYAIGQPARTLAGATLPAVLRGLAQCQPEHIVFHLLNLRGETTTLNAGALLDRAEAVARGLAQAGVGRGDVVLLALETSPELLVSFFGCGLAGAVPCLLGLPTTAAQRLTWAAKLRSCAEVTGAVAVVADEAETGGIPAHTPGMLEQQGRHAPRVEGAAHELAFMQFTSGTTSRPKAIAISHQALLVNARGLAQNADWRDGELVVGWLPLHHDMGLVATTLTAFLHGLPTVLMPPAAFMLKPARWFWAIHAFQGTQSFAPNFAY